MAKTFKVFPDDFLRLYKITKRKTPIVPKFEEKHPKLTETDVDS
jgi:hypothetical protein